MRTIKSKYHERDRVIVHVVSEWDGRDEYEECEITQVLGRQRYRVQPHDDGSYVVGEDMIISKA